MVIHQYYRELKGKDVLFTRLSDPLNRAYKDDVWKNRTKVSDFVRKQTELILKGNRYFCVTGIPEYPEGIVCQPYFTLTPIGPTLQEYQNIYGKNKRNGFRIIRILHGVSLSPVLKN